MKFSETPRLLACGASLSREGARLRALDFGVAPGVFHVFTGKRGAGHEGAMRLLGLLDPPDAGEVLLDGVATSRLDGESREELRAARFGYLFDAPFLLPTMSVIENVAMPIFKILQVAPVEARRRTEELLAFVGLPLGSGAFTPDRLTPEEQQRVALARALSHQPEFLVIEDADALPGFATLLPLIRRAAMEFGVTVLAAGGPDFPTATGDRVIECADGTIRADALVGGGAAA